MFSPIFVADTKIIYDYKFVALLTSMEFETEKMIARKGQTTAFQSFYWLVSKW